MKLMAREVKGFSMYSLMSNSLKVQIKNLQMLQRQQKVCSQLVTLWKQQRYIQIFIV